MTAAATMTHLMDVSGIGGRRFPDRPFPTALCGAEDPGPIDLTPHGGVITCPECLALAAARPSYMDRLRP